jgi:rfaE bifunctional protein nucleotidyltransferase chain/domain
VGRGRGSRELGEVVAQSELILRRAEWKRNGRRVVFASGVFDLLHPGHIRLLEQARSLGDVLVVAVQSDAAVKAAHQPAHGMPADSASRPPARPVTPAAERAEILAALAAVDCVVEFDGASPQQLTTQLAPDVIVEGQSGSTGAEAVATIAATTTTKTVPNLVRIPLEPGYSTTRLLERIKYLRQPNA